jgi:hypothetical protein
MVTERDILSEDQLCQFEEGVMVTERDKYPFRRSVMTI